MSRSLGQKKLHSRQMTRRWLVTPTWYAAGESRCESDSGRLHFLVKVQLQLNFTHLVGQIYAAVLPRLEAPDIDHEIKGASIDCAGKIVCVHGDVMSGADRDVLLSHLRADWTTR